MAKKPQKKNAKVPVRGKVKSQKPAPKKKLVKTASKAKAIAKKAVKSKPSASAKAKKKLAIKPKKLTAKPVKKLKLVAKTAKVLARKKPASPVKKAVAAVKRPAATKKKPASKPKAKVVVQAKKESVILPMKTTAKPEKAISQPKIVKPEPKIVSNNTSNNTKTPTMPTEKTRYSDEELQEFRELIIKKMDKARSELEYLQESIKSPTDNAADEFFSANKLMEDNSLSTEKEHMSGLAERQRKFIKNLEDALVRIENKTYGICKETGKLISKERLRAVPHTTLSMEAKMKQK